ncbi:MAG: hypothetical protein QOJ89_5392 [bacterium]|jgi:hypothetical protein
MILVVEGPSAAGKTTWAGQWPARLLVPETGRARPPAGVDRQAVAEFWVDLNCARWSRAMTIERTAEIAICDTDPLKLHYDYCLARVGKGSWEQFWAGVEACRSAIAGERLGIADLIVCAVPGETTLDRRRDSDPSKARSNFAINRTLGPALVDWYRTLERLDPGRVTWAFPSELPKCEMRPRFGLRIFDEWMRALPGMSHPDRNGSPPAFSKPRRCSP